MSKKVVTVIGARPQFVKAAAVSRAISQTGLLKEVLVHTGQHYDENMSAVFFEEMAIPAPAYHLGVGSGLHGAQTGAMLARIEEVLDSERPAAVLVYGDTNSTMAGALAAVKMHIPVAHVEAGLRSFNRRMPEEINRVVTDHVAEVLYAPTPTAMANLASEGCGARSVLTGDVMYDVSLYFSACAAERTGLLKELGLGAGDYLLVTIHRAENTDDPVRLAAIVDALIALASFRPIIFPMHPRTARVLRETGLLSRVEASLQVLPPCGYLDMVTLQTNAVLVITDSGGIQKEALFFGTPCVTLREETEWLETLEGGWNVLVAPHSARVIRETVEAALLTRRDPAARTKAFGDGSAAIRIARDLAGRLK